ncbi:MAG: calcium-binding protein [Blastocatellia bacterium]|nr:calcium-binding protein [Blastocatellia bacterium]
MSLWEKGGPLQDGDRLKIKDISGVDDMYGIIVEVRLGKKRYDFPLCELKVRNRRSANYQMVRDYAVWFANR